MESVLLLNQHSATSRSGRGKLVNASLAEHHIAAYVVPNSSITDAGSIPSPFFLLVFAAVVGLRLPDKLALAEEDVMNK